MLCTFHTRLLKDSFVVRKSGLGPDLYIGMDRGCLLTTDHRSLLFLCGRALPLFMDCTLIQGLHRQAKTATLALLRTNQERKKTFHKLVRHMSMYHKYTKDAAPTLELFICRWTPTCVTTTLRSFSGAIPSRIDTNRLTGPLLNGSCHASNLIYFRGWNST